MGVTICMYVYSVVLQLVPPKLVPRTIYGSYIAAWPPRTICGTADGPRAFSTAVPPYDPAFITFY